jgi:hypothetical protein
MHHRQSKSLARLQSSITKELSQFEMIRLTHSRKSLPQHTSKSTSSFKPHQKVFNKSASCDSKRFRADSASKIKPVLTPSKLSVSVNLHTRYEKGGKVKSNLKKKGVILSRGRPEGEPKSLASTKCLETKSSTCDQNC